MTALMMMFVLRPDKASYLAGMKVQIGWRGDANREPSCSRAGIIINAVRYL